MKNAIEIREDGIYLSIGKDVEDKYRKHILWYLWHLEDACVLDGYDPWIDFKRPKEEYRIKQGKELKGLRLSLRAIELYNKLTDEVITVDDSVYNRLKELEAEEQAAHEEAIRKRREERLRCIERERIRKQQLEQDNVVLWKGMTRGELRDLIRRGLLVETPETKTLYEMYDDGLI